MSLCSASNTHLKDRQCVERGLGDTATYQGEHTSESEVK
jgi:hypothetical protein